MKPLVYFNDFKSYDDTHVIVDNKRLQEIFEEVYNAGYADGKDAHSPVWPTGTNIRSVDITGTPNSNFGQISTNAEPLSVKYGTADMGFGKQVK